MKKKNARKERAQAHFSGKSFMCTFIVVACHHLPRVTMETHYIAVNLRLFETPETSACIKCTYIVHHGYMPPYNNT